MTAANSDTVDLDDTIDLTKNDSDDEMSPTTYIEDSEDSQELQEFKSSSTLLVLSFLRSDTRSFTISVATFSKVASANFSSVASASGGASEHPEAEALQHCLQSS
ncbi:hypothetical protein DdX_13358 [Ditylenchus destructor]|uniref:Uncharacterized protein n=1 Tax=Ditylenchus destructor TaxID=166010 RepID=A0AAD4MTS0_9BILA|nr:hypothetical protein DdX_13358 [Ditylenchus destructor]